MKTRRQAKSTHHLLSRQTNHRQCGSSVYLIGCRPRKAHTQQPQKFPKLLKVEKLSVPSKFGLCADERPEGTLGSRPHFSKVAKISLTSEKGNWWKEVQYLQASSRLNKK
ncbi:hypothetical protein CIHG_03841 [Coccidioides immitis H538.4]|uniref:Uncharacterized protein n=1 Tax=Coccidioides immitis H538.4 TaxID=396776 RepID=A0A0J8RLQ4_COCIT|nr:hypothetical protein CIHG_03841 [Coccidioides immitis H538.4]